MNERNEYYSYYEKLMRMPAQEAMEQSPEYQSLASRYPHLSKSIKLRKDLQRLRKELKSAKHRPTKLQISAQIRILDAELKRQNTVKRVHVDGKAEKSYKRRFAIAALSQLLAGWCLSTAQAIRLALLKLQNAYSELQRRRRKLAQRARLSRSMRLPPSLSDLRSLDPVERGLAVREWIEKHRIRIQGKNPLPLIDSGT